MAWKLGVHAAKAEDQRLVPSTYIKQLTIASNTGFSKSDALSWMPQVTIYIWHIVTSTSTHPHKNIFKNKYQIDDFY